MKLDLMREKQVSELYCGVSSVNLNPSSNVYLHAWFDLFAALSTPKPETVERY